MQLQGMESSDYTDRSHCPAAAGIFPQLWMFIDVPSLDFPHRQGHNSGALLDGEMRSNEASGGRFRPRNVSMLSVHRDAKVSN